MNEVEVYTTREIATILRVSNKTVYKIIHDGDLEAIWVRGQIRITSQALQRYIGGPNGKEI